MNYNRPITIYTASSRKAAVLQETPISIQELISRLANSQSLPYTHEAYMKLSKAQQDELKDVGAYIAGTLQGGRRKAGSVITRCAAVLDADNLPPGGTEAFVQAVSALDLCYCIHSTAKHSPATPRLRVIIPFASDIEADKYAPAIRRLCQIIQLEMSWFDPTTDEPGRIMCWPAHCTDVEPVYHWGEGRGLLDAEALLQQAPDWRDISSWPTFPRGQAPAKRAAKQEDPEGKTGVVGAFCRVYDIPTAMDKFLPGIYEPTTQTERYTFSGGSTAGGTVLYENGKFLFSHHATDPCSGKLVNAFDMVRLHRFGDLDDEAKEGAPVNRRPSYMAMRQFAQADEATADELARIRALEIQAAFGDMANENAGEELARCAGENLSAEIVRKSLSAFGIQARNNLITGKVEITGLPAVYSQENAANVLPVLLLDRLRTAGVKAVNKTAITDYLTIVCDEMRYNPVVDFLENVAWDGMSRFAELYRIMGVDPRSFSATLIRKWLIQCVAMAHNTLQNPIGLEGVLTLKGPQGRGKTLLFRKLAFNSDWFVEGASIDLRDKDSIIKAVSGWIDELGELDSTLRRDQSSIKAFITSPSDRVRAPYVREATFRPRRTSFCATVNPGEFLRDETGDRRFWVVDIETLDLPALVALTHEWVEQLWAEAYRMWQSAPAGFRLTALEQEALDKSNQKYRQSLPGEIELRERMDFDLPREHWGEFTASSILLGMREKVDSGQMGKVLAKLEREDTRITFRKKDGYKVYSLPIPRAFSVMPMEVKMPP